MHAPESKPVNLAGLSGKNAPQPAPKYDKGIAGACVCVVCVCVCMCMYVCVCEEAEAKSLRGS